MFSICIDQQTHCSLLQAHSPSLLWTINDMTLVLCPIPTLSGDNCMHGHPCRVSEPCFISYDTILYTCIEQTNPVICKSFTTLQIIQKLSIPSEKLPNNRKPVLWGHCTDEAYSWWSRCSPIAKRWFMTQWSPLKYSQQSKDIAGMVCGS
jgi:hypothetical protein